MTRKRTPTDLPDPSEAEESLISACLVDGGASVDRCRAERIGADSFYSAANRLIFGVILDLRGQGVEVDAAVLAEELKRRDQLAAAGGFAYIAQVSGRVSTTSQLSYWCERVREQHIRRQLLHRIELAREGCFDAGRPLAEVLEGFTSNLPQLHTSETVLEKMAARRAGFGRAITKQQPTFYLLDTPIFTRGNLALVTALQKVGKSAVVGAMIGAAIAGEGDRKDTLGFRAVNLDGHALLHIDTEQAPEDHESLIDTALRRVPAEKLPDWVYSYGMKGVAIQDLHAALEALLAELKRVHGGVYAVILDGVADLVADPNDPKEVNPVVTKLEGLAATYACSFVCVLHLNPAPANQLSMAAYY